MSEQKKKGETYIPLTKEDYDCVYSKYPDSKRIVLTGQNVTDILDQLRRLGVELGNTQAAMYNIKTLPDFVFSKADMKSVYEIVCMLTKREGSSIKMGFETIGETTPVEIDIVYQE